LAHRFFRHSSSSQTLARTAQWRFVSERRFRYHAWLDENLCSDPIIARGGRCSITPRGAEFSKEESCRLL